MDWQSEDERKEKKAVQKTKKPKGNPPGQGTHHKEASHAGQSWSAFVRLCVCAFVRLCACAFVRLIVCAFVRLCVCLFMRLFVCLFVCV